MVKSWYWVALDMLQPVDAPSTYASPVNKVNICKLPSGENLENALGMALANCWYFGGQLSSYVWSFIPGDGNRCTRFNKYCIGDVSEFAWIEEAPDNVASLLLFDVPS
ncbi:hypothetical protein GH714_005356 [Hevea brasiliensis]|uniref:Uncharacterized protein n=1 Tax=Hevea brasiliensis TaxID=3981 RepID=A0A6A6LA80_HEVBR|nr:hypothetical protein GH714_005356 [Hevea brasiliensis]